MPNDNRDNKDTEISLTPNMTKIDIPADIERLTRDIMRFESDIQHMNDSIKHLRKWQQHDQALIDGDNQYNKEQLQQNIEAKNVDIRKCQDVITAQKQRIEFTRSVIAELRERLNGNHL